MSKKIFTDFVLDSIFDTNGIRKAHLDVFNKENGFKVVLENLVLDYISKNNNFESSFLFSGNDSYQKCVEKITKKKLQELFPKYDFPNRFNQLKKDNFYKEIGGLENVFKAYFFSHPDYVFQSKDVPEIEGLKIGEIEEPILWDKNRGIPKFIPNPKDGKDKLINLLYAVIWKNGDINKVKQLLEPIAKDVSNDSFVFRYFGDFLTENTNYNKPIIDQHVLRAFGVWKNNEMINLTSNFNKLNSDNYELVNQYNVWFLKIMNGFENNRHNVNRNIDKLLFSVGRIIKP